MSSEHLKRVEEVVNFKGMPIVAKRYYVDAQGRRQGIYEEMDIHGVVVKRGTCVDDKFDGLLEIKKDSKNYQIISYSNGKREGLFVEYQNGLLVRRGSYHDDKLVQEDKFQYNGPQCSYTNEWYRGWIETLKKEKTLAKPVADKLKRGR